MSTTTSPIVLDAWRAASFTQYSLVATIVSMRIGVFGFAALNRFAYSTKWLARSPWRQCITSSVTPAATGAPAAAGVLPAAAAAGLVGSAGAAAGAAGLGASPVLTAAVAAVWSGGGAHAARAAVA